MEKNGNIVRASAEEIQAMLDRGESRTDWERVRAMPREEVERLADEEDGPLPEGWESTITTQHPSARAAPVRLDSDIIAWFRAAGPGYEARINAALREFVRTHERTD